MKKITIILWLATLITVGGCGKSKEENQEKNKADIPSREEILGKYIFQGDPQLYVELKSDGTFYYVNQKSGEKKGKWKIVDGDDLLISGPFGGLPLIKIPFLERFTSSGVWRWKIKDKTTIIDAEGSVWIKKARVTDSNEKKLSKNSQ